ncbi:MAG: hemerythrin domain-containing protein [Dehalococcoidia bacterium]|nr:hemerythrin domain-containing protein [Dehalococcoidia bacterium]
MDDRVVGPLREARRPLHLGLRQLQLAAQAVSEAEPKVAQAAIDAAVAFLDEKLLPQCRAEEFTLFPAVDGVIGRKGATDVMFVQHEALNEMAADLHQVVEAARTDNDVAAYGRYLLPLLHGLYALTRAHLEAEDRAYIALLDEHLSESQVGVIVDNIERIAANRPPDATVRAGE